MLTEYELTQNVDEKGGYSFSHQITLKPTEDI